MSNEEQLSTPSIWRWLLLQSRNWSICILCFWAAEAIDHFFFYWFFTLIIGTRQHAILIMGHDGAHYCISRDNPKLNDWIAGLFAFWPLGLGLDAYRAFHFSHHIYTGTQNDPELLHKAQVYPDFEPPLSKRQILIYIIKDLSGLSFGEILRLGRLLPPKSKKDIYMPIIVSFSLFGATYFVFGTWAALMWLWALFTSFWCAFRFRVWTEHICGAPTHAIEAGWFFRVFVTPNNTWMHYEHHASPLIPSWNLPKARKLFKTKPISVRSLFKRMQWESGDDYAR